MSTRIRSTAAQHRPVPIGTWVVLAFPSALLLTLGLAVSTAAEDAPLTGQPSVPPDPVGVIPELSEMPPLWEGAEPALRWIAAEPFGPEDKGGAYTAMERDGFSGGLTERESALLALSDAAVEASRTAGTLQPPPIERPGPTVTRAEAEDRKLEALRQGVPSAPVPGSGAPTDRITAPGSRPAPANAAASTRPDPLRPEPPSRPDRSSTSGPAPSSASDRVPSPTSGTAPSSPVAAEKGGQR